MHASRLRAPDGVLRGAYEPPEAGPCACAFLGGGDALLCIAVREGWRERTLVGPQGRRWRDVLGPTY